MWWESNSEDETRVQREIERLKNLVIEHAPFSKLVYGVGSIFWHGQLAPLLIVDRDLDPRRQRDPFVRGLLFGAPFFQLVYDLVGPLWPLSYSLEQLPTGLDLILRIVALVLRPSMPRPLEWIFGAAKNAGNDFRFVFQNWSLPEDLIVLFSPQPKSVSAMGVTPITRTSFGTVGLVGTINGKASGFTTAGHVVEGLGTLASRAIWVLGIIFPFGEKNNIVFHADPRGGPAGYDLAIVSSEDCSAPLSFEAEGEIVTDPRQVNRFALCHLDGAVSGHRWGIVNGTLDVFQANQRQWVNCWAVIGQSGWVCKQGDSGSLVKLNSGSILGVLVGGLRIGGLLWGNRMEVGFVQDLQSTIEFARTSKGFNIQIL